MDGLVWICLEQFGEIWDQINKIMVAVSNIIAITYLNSTAYRNNWAFLFDFISYREIKLVLWKTISFIYIRY